jgi:hypothetical protein
VAKPIVRRALQIIGNPALRSADPKPVQRGAGNMPAISAARPPPRGSDLATAAAVLHEAAAHFKTQLTPHDVAIERVGQASQ